MSNERPLPGSVGYKSFNDFILQDEEWEFEFFRSVITVCAAGRLKGTNLDFIEEKNHVVWGGIMHEATMLSGKFTGAIKPATETNFKDKLQVKAFLLKRPISYWMRAFRYAPDGKAPPEEQCNGILWPWNQYLETLKDCCLLETLQYHFKDIKVINVGHVRAMTSDIELQKASEREREKSKRLRF